MSEGSVLRFLQVLAGWMLRATWDKGYTVGSNEEFEARQSGVRVSSPVMRKTANEILVK